MRLYKNILLLTKFYLKGKNLNRGLETMESHGLIDGFRCPLVLTGSFCSWLSYRLPWHSWVNLRKLSESFRNNFVYRETWRPFYTM